MKLYTKKQLVSFLKEAIEDEEAYIGDVGDSDVLSGEAGDAFFITPKGELIVLEEIRHDDIGGDAFGVDLGFILVTSYGDTVGFRFYDKYIPTKKQMEAVEIFSYHFNGIAYDIIEVIKNKNKNMYETDVLQSSKTGNISIKTLIRELNKYYYK